MSTSPALNQQLMFWMTVIYTVTDRLSCFNRYVWEVGRDITVVSTYLSAAPTVVTVGIQKTLFYTTHSLHSGEQNILNIVHYYKQVGRYKHRCRCRCRCTLCYLYYLSSFSSYLSCACSENLKSTTHSCVRWGIMTVMNYQNPTM